jgi:hypothetical protein
MLDTLEVVMKRIPDLRHVAELARDQIEAAAGRGILGEPPAIILGGSATYPLLDLEDAGVLNTAMALHADLLVTSNMADFVRGPRARTSTAILSRRSGVPDVIRLSHPKHPGGLVIATPYQAAGWLIRGEPTPPSVALGQVVG